MSGHRLVLASASPRRKALLAQIGITPDEISPADIDEDVIGAERAGEYVRRLCAEKAVAVAAKNMGAYVLAADTAVAVGRRILPKAEDQTTAISCLELISGRSHRVYTGVALITPDRSKHVRVVETRVKVRRLSSAAITEYLASKEWEGKAGGYAIQGLFSKHIASITGSYTNVVGLPLYETANLLDHLGSHKG